MPESSGTLGLLLGTMLPGLASVALLTALGSVNGVVIQHDDLANLAVAQDYSYLNKMPATGRWLSYISAPPFVLLTSWPIYFINVIAWSIGCAIISWRILRGGRLWSVMLIAFLLAGSPPYLSLLQWPYVNAFISLWFLLYSITVALPKRHFVTFPAMVAGSILIYQPLAILLLAIEIVISPHGSNRRPIVSVLIAFVFGVAAGVFVQNTINLIIFGHFGLVLESWRQVIPISSMSAVVQRVARACSQFAEIVMKYYWGFGATLIGAVLVSRAGYWSEVYRPISAIVAAAATIIAIGVATGAKIDFRITPALWLGAVILIGKLVEALMTVNRRSLLVFWALVMLTCGPVYQIYKECHVYWRQAAQFQGTEHRAEQIVRLIEAHQEDGKKIVFVGSVLNGFRIGNGGQQFSNTLQLSGALHRQGLRRDYLICAHANVPRCHRENVDYQFAETLPRLPAPGAIASDERFVYVRLGDIAGVSKLAPKVLPK